MTMEAQPPKEQQQDEKTLEEPPRDEEGLLLHYDVVLCGTGLVQSLLASALARAGKTVLHCDGNDYYGEYDGVVPLNWKPKEENENVASDEEPLSLRPRASVRLHSTNTLTHVPINVGTQVSTPYGIGEIISPPSSNTTDGASSVAIQLKDWTLANGTSPIVHVGVPGDTLWQEQLQTLNVIPTRLQQAQKVLQQQRYFALDLTPSLLYASGPAVQALLTSGVAEYMEFKALEGLLWYSPEKGELVRVPCSKGDVFGTSLLSPLEKRRLMKFLQLTLDYATAQQQQLESEETVANNKSDNDTTTSTLKEVQSLNEQHLNQGRSLARPQNKAVATNDVQILEESLEMPFPQYLSQHAKLSDHLIQIVQHALCLEPTSFALTTRQGMQQLCQHVQSLGRFGTTAFIVPMYGCGELSQSFCRSAAVHGATYLLRRAPKRIVVNDDDKTVQGIQLSLEDDAKDDNAKFIPCEHVVVPSHAIASLSNNNYNKTRRVYRRTSIVLGKLLEDQDEQRHVLIIPPGEVDNAYAVHGLVVDATVGVSPQGCTVLHLTTTADQDDDPPDQVLEQIVKQLNGDEIHHVSFSYSLPHEEVEEEIAGIDCLHLCQPLGQSVTLDSQVEQAQCIFQSICPNMEFLKRGKEMEEVVQEQLAGREDVQDEEKRVLESAMDMMEDSTAASKQENQL